MIKVGSELFKKELSLIKDDSIKQLVKQILDEEIHYDNFFRTSSSTGKYHPDFDNVMYGNTNHTKAVVKLCKTILKSRQDLSPYYQDIIYASAILHDMWKYDGRSTHTRKDHALVAYNVLKKYNEDLATCVLYHMGHWQYTADKLQWIKELKNLSPELYDSVLILHYADLIASRNFYNIQNYAI